MFMATSRFWRVVILIINCYLLSSIMRVKHSKTSIKSKKLANSHPPKGLVAIWVAILGENLLLTMIY
jgi:hypothetical protein